jgi:hypothetical protein
VQVPASQSRFGTKLHTARSQLTLLKVVDLVEAKTVDEQPTHPLQGNQEKSLLLSKATINV